MDQTKLKELQGKAIKYAFKHHYDNCDFYRNYCKNSGDVRPGDIHSIEDIINKVPQIPVETFKKGLISSVPQNRIHTVVTTSGTSGSVSYLVRDFGSLIRLGVIIVNYIINIGAPEALEEQKRFDGKYSKIIKYALTNWYLAPLLPDPNEASTWFTSAFKSLIPFMKMFGIPYDFHLKGFEFNPEKIIRTIKEKNEENKMVFLVGFHYVYNELMKYMDEIGETLELDPDGSNLCFTILAGGWKKLSGEAIDKKAFEKKLSDHFGLYEPHIIDIYGFGESNTLTVDFCPEGNMHLSPGVLAVTRDPKTLEVQDYGEKGLMSVWDPTMLSFPAFVISDDIVKLSEPFECDGCGAISQTVEYVGRAEKAELRSCGLKTQQILNDEDKKAIEIVRAKTLRSGIGF
jgi:long-chain-fatty-acid---luciferin-component ligase